MRQMRPFTRCRLGRFGSRARAAARSGAVQIGVLLLGVLFALGVGSSPACGQERSRTAQAPISDDPFNGFEPLLDPRALVRTVGEDAERPYDEPDVREPVPGSTGEDDYFIPAHPQDPLWPTWKPVNDPARQPIFAPAGDYQLVRPPTGLWPEEEGQDYERIVATDSDLFFHESTCPPPIDLFRADGFAPAGVIGDHTINTGGRVIISHRFNNQAFDGLLTGAHSVSTASVLNQFQLAPTRMTGQEHLFIMEWGPTDDLTLQGILPIVLRRIDYVGRDGSLPVTDVTDLYDIQLYALYVLKRWDRQQIHLNMGVQMPLGIFDPLQSGGTILVPTPTSPQLTYPVRTSDGTWDYLPGITYRGQSDRWTWGIQGLGIVRFGINRYGYRLGDEGNFNGWLSRRLTDWASASVRLNGHVWGNIFGADQRLNTALVPTNVPSLQAGQRMSILFGMNFMIPNGILRGQLLGIEGGIPIYQSLDGPQLRQRSEIWTNLTITW